MRSFLSLLLLSTCVPAATLRGEDALRSGRASEALASFDAALGEDPSDARAKTGRTQALQRVFAEQLEAVKTARAAHRFEAALDGVQAGEALLRRGANGREALESERAEVGKAVATWLQEPLTVSQPLEAEARLGALGERLEGAGLVTVGIEARSATQAVGARRCAVLGSLAKTPWLARFLAQYCDHFHGAPPVVPPMPERRAALQLTESVRGSASLASTVRGGLDDTFKRSVWFSPEPSVGLPVSVAGAVESDVRRQPIDTFVTWTESESYQTTENVTENYTESYMAYESRPYTRTVTTTESYTYSCGSGTRYQTCYGTRPVTRTVTEYRNEYVSKTRPATRTVTKTVYKTRPVSKRFDFKAVQVTAKHAGTLEVSFALPGTKAPLTVKTEERQQGDDLDHDVTHRPAGLTAHRAVVPTAESLQEKLVKGLSSRLAAALEQAWLDTFCAAVETPDEAARCLASSQAPETAWLALARFTGEAPLTLQRVFGRVR